MHSRAPRPEPRRTGIHGTGADARQSGAYLLAWRAGARAAWARRLRTMRSARDEVIHFMPNASSDATRAGFEIYRALPQPVDHGQLNTELAKAGFDPISARTFNHYGKLVKAGYNRYLSINRFDVARASRAYENASATSRYRYQNTNIRVRLRLATSNRTIDTIGRITQIGEPGAVVEFTGDSAVRNLHTTRPRVGDELSLELSRTGRVLGGRVADIFFATRRCVVEVEFATLASMSDLVPVSDGTDSAGSADSLGNSFRTVRSPAPQSIQFTLQASAGVASAEPAPTADLTGRRLYYLLELLEGARALVNRVSLASEDGGYAAPPTLHRLQAQSAISMTVDVPPCIAAVVSAASEIASAARHTAEIRQNPRAGTQMSPASQGRASRGSNEPMMPPPPLVASQAGQGRASRGRAGRGSVDRASVDLRQARAASEAAEARSCEATVALLQQSFAGHDVSNDDIEQVLRRDVFPHAHDLGRLGIDKIRIKHVATKQPRQRTTR